MSKQVNVLYLDDEFNNTVAFRATFRRFFTVHTTVDPAEARQIVDNHDIHVVLADQRMPKIEGVDFLAEVQEAHPKITRVLITAYTDINSVIGAINKGEVYRYIEKPWDESTVVEIIESAYAKYQNAAKTTLAKDDTSLLAKITEHYIYILKKIRRPYDHKDILEKVNRTVHLSQEIFVCYALEDSRNNLSAGTTKSMRLSLQDYTALIRIHDVKVILSHLSIEEQDKKCATNSDMLLQAATLFSQIKILPDTCRQSLQEQIQALH